MGEKRHHKPAGVLKRALVENIYAQIRIPLPPEERLQQTEATGPGVTKLVKDYKIVTGNAQRLLGSSDVRLSTVEEAAEKLGVSPEALLRRPDGKAGQTAQFDLEGAFRAVLAAVSRLTPNQWSMVREGIGPVVGRPEMIDDVVDDVAPLLLAASSRKQIGAGG